ncbi:ABC transporter ATP-binding protein [Flavobacterium aquatile]|uniref:ABC transporter ATP-binding protein n=1 Tax=Flavobacterium aquatile LMG 4008 = ATCC 11947 TaxID=1453498 RepID=A0A095STX9_9FLAO|nr:ATP-binding cassette domain-containing protein [Flavobacterium aquatile]KGD68052.1 ABC transporter ATP-binding protein [Flavobacterium aquatile LMG 4008 = ATCC 11947]OXA69012.1 ABC transporter ATP-binding protein [Flavobacterium aquatile LMG 4008 = ATCC 11947]GEC77482.1 ABC transporter ATP-binding protein [Flavobacterium aquatile]
MLQTKNVTFFYNKETQFTFPELKCNASDVLLITGNSGKGKTTLLHLLAGLLRPKNGEISIENTNISSLSEKKLDQFRGKNIGLILQQSHFIASMSVLENVVLASWLATGKKAILKAEKLLAELDLENQKHKLPSQLSIGQQQRVSIARALINEPKLLLADEPTSSLDDENAFKVADLLEKLSKEYKAALVIVTHDSRLKNKFTNQINLN